MCNRFSYNIRAKAGFSFYQGMQKIIDEIKIDYEDINNNIKYISAIDLTLNWANDEPELEEHFNFSKEKAQNYKIFEKELCNQYIAKIPTHKTIKTIKIEITTTPV